MLQVGGSATVNIKLDRRAIRMPTSKIRRKTTVQLNEVFRRLSKSAADALGTPWMFFVNLLLIIVWLAFGPFAQFSDSWQLIVNTGTTVLTYLAVFLIQNTQNRDSKAVHLKLDELISSVEGARNRLVDLQSLTDAELEEIEQQFRRLQAKALEKDVDDARAIAGSPENT
jgi:low affinity Fe/Cu permease